MVGNYDHQITSVSICHYIIICLINCTFLDSDDPWFKGFLRPEEVSHLPTRMFLHKELFISNIQDTNPIRSIIGKCAVLFVSDYCKGSVDIRCYEKKLIMWLGLKMKLLKFYYFLTILISIHIVIQQLTEAQH